MVILKENSAEHTVILDKSNSDGFMDFNKSSERNTAIKILKRLKTGDGSETD